MQEAWRTIFQCWKIDSGRWLLVRALWFVLTVSLFIFVAKYGQNIPSWEEWTFLGPVMGETDSNRWVLGRLQEHRYVLGRVVYATLMEFSDHNFVVPMHVSVLLMAAAGWLLLDTIRWLRGTTYLADGFIPLVLLNPGGAENLFLGYQVAFALDVLLMSLLIQQVSLANRTPAKLIALRCSVLLGLLSLGGWIGLAFVPAGTVWVIWLTIRGFRIPAAQYTIPLTWLCCLLACGSFAYCYWDLKTRPLPGTENDPQVFVPRVALEFLSTFFGALGSKWWPVSGVLAVMLVGVVVGSLLFTQVPQVTRRASAWGWLMILAAFALMGYGLATKRPNGFASRNFQLTALACSTCYIVLGKLVWQLKGWRGQRWLNLAFVLMAIPLGWLIVYRGWKDGSEQASFYRERVRQFQRDCVVGLPKSFLASKHLLFPFPQFPKALDILQRAKHPSVHGMKDDPPHDAVPLMFEPGTPDALPSALTVNRPQPTAQVWSSRLPEAQHLLGAEVYFGYAGHTVRVPIHLVWQRPDGTLSRTVIAPWLIPYQWTLRFFIDDTVSALWIYPEDPREVLDLHSLHGLIGTLEAPK